MKAIVPRVTNGVHLPPDTKEEGRNAEIPAATVEALKDLAVEASSDNTTRSYRAALRYWAAWHLARLGMPLAMPVQEAAVLQFIVDHASRATATGETTFELPSEVDAALVAMGIKGKPGPAAISTLAHRLTVLSRAHVLADVPNPCQTAPVRQALAQAKRAYAKRGQTARKKPALTRVPLEAVLSTCDESLRGKRDRAVLLFAWASGGRRRSEVASALHERLRREGAGFLYDLGASKTNQAGELRAEDQKPLVGQAATALQAWIAASGVSSGPIFRRIDASGRIGTALSASGVRDIVKSRCAAAGLDAAFSAHSMRSGFVTEAGRQGVALTETMALSGHRSVATVAGYHRAGAALMSPGARLLEEPMSKTPQEAPRPPRVILDKSFVQGGRTQVIRMLCEHRQALMPDVLFYEMLTSEEPGRSRCFAKFPGTNPVIIVPNVGTLLQFELDHHRPCGLPSAHASSITYQFNPRLAAREYMLPATAQETLNEEEIRLEGEIETLIEMINMAPDLFPDSFQGTAVERERAQREAQRVLATDEASIVEFYSQLTPTDPAIKPPPAEKLSRDWIHFRWLQVKLSASLQLHVKYGPVTGTLTPKRRHEFENFVLDMQYAMLALLEGGLASKDDWLRALFVCLRPDGLLMPSAEELMRERQAQAAVNHRERVKST